MGTPGSTPRTRSLPQAVTALCTTLLRDAYLPRIERALAELPPGDLWWRPHARSTSAGNLLLHLEGNVRQWIVCGLGGAPDRRERDAEFAARAGAGAPELLDALRVTVERACEVVARLDAAALAGRVQVQGFDVSRLEAVLHAVEHMSWHAGQIAWIAKLRAGAGHGLAYYADARLRKRNAGRRRD